MRHENTIAFMGACVEPSNICILTRYCRKGALDDIIGNSDIQLDLMFNVSFIMDIINVGLLV